MKLEAAELAIAVLLPWGGTIAQSSWSAKRDRVELSLLPSGWLCMAEPGGQRRRLVSPAQVLQLDAEPDADTAEQARLGMQALEERLLRERITRDALEALDAYDDDEEETDE